MKLTINKASIEEEWKNQDITEKNELEPPATTTIQEEVLGEGLDETSMQMARHEDKKRKPEVPECSKTKRRCLETLTN